MRELSKRLSQKLSESVGQDTVTIDREDLEAALRTMNELEQEATDLGAELILMKTDEQLLAEARDRGDDPEAFAQKMREFVRQSAERSARLRDVVPLTGEIS